jgi:hypothetical protein
MVKVKKINDISFDVTVQGRTVSTHRVTVSPSYYDKLTGGLVTPEVLIAKSFEFLLERESNTSILRSFDLPVIEQYFPEYEAAIQVMIKQP